MHRDFKPGNVLVGADGAARVADFGLATDDDELELPPSFVTDRSDRHHDFTLTGDLLGTPRYMAPEQLAPAFSGEALGPRADQYAWCVAVYRALWMAEPFEALDMRGLLAAKAEGPRTPPDRRAVPRWVWPVLARGMAPGASDRHASMDALLAELARARTHRPRRCFAFATLGGGGVLAVVLLARVGANDACHDAQALDVWTAADRQTWRESPAGRVVMDGDDNFAAQMDRHRERFHAVVAEVCEGEVDAPTAAAVVECLTIHQSQVDALVRDVVQLPAELGPFTDLPGTQRLAEACLDPQYRAIASPQSLVRDSSREYEAVAYIRLGRLDEARAIAREILRDDDGLHRETVAWAVLGSVAEAEGDFEPADEWFQASYFRCATLANHGCAANSAAHLTGIHIGLGRADQVALWTRNAEIELARAGGDPAIESILQNGLGEAALWRGDYDEARDHYQRATDVLASVRGDDAETVEGIRNNLALALERTGDSRARSCCTNACSRVAWPGTARATSTCTCRRSTSATCSSGSARSRKRVCTATRRLRPRSRRSVATACSPTRPDSLAQIDLSLGGDRLAEAETLLDEVAPGPADAIEGGLVAMQHEVLLGWQARRAGDLADARARLERATVLAHAHLGEGNPLARDVEIERLVIEALGGDEAGGLGRLRAIATGVTAGDPSARIDRGLVLVQLGEVLLELGRADEAVPVLAEATELLASSWVDSAHARRATELLSRAQADPPPSTPYVD